MAKLYFSKRLAPFLERRAFARRMMDAIETGSVRVVLAAASCLGIERASDLGAALAGRIGPRLRKHRNVARNLAILFPEKSESERALIARNLWANIGRTLTEHAHLDPIMNEPRASLESRFDLDELRRSDKGAVFVGMHQGNWNVHALAGHLGGFPLTVIFRPQRDPRLEALIASWRNRMPCGFIPVNRGVRGIIRELEQGRSVGLFTDFRVDSGPDIPFAGHPAPTTTIAARIAIKAGVPLIPGQVIREPGVRFRIILHEPIRAQPDLPEREAGIAMMTEVNRRFESWARSEPDQWFCTKHRWSKKTVFAVLGIVNDGERARLEAQKADRIAA